MKRTAFPVATACVALVFAVVASTAAAAQVTLLVSQSLAFSYLGHSCGGIQEQSYALGFDPSSGYPYGDVYMSTRCGGSGRGGGYHSHLYSAWATVTWDFAGNVLNSTLGETGSPTSPFSATDANGDTVTNVGTLAYLSVPAPGSPAITSVTQSGSSAQVTWTPAPPNPNVISSSTITATPVGSGTTVTSPVTGPAATGLVGPLQPATTYQITVVSSTIGGSSAPSAPVTFTTAVASIPPGAPTGLAAHWTAPLQPGDTAVVTWKAPSKGGDSPIDSYQVKMTDTDTGKAVNQTVPGTTLTASFVLSDIPDYKITVRAHNAAGWGKWSAAFLLGGV